MDTSLPLLLLLLLIAVLFFVLFLKRRADRLTLRGPGFEARLEKGGDRNESRDEPPEEADQLPGGSQVTVSHSTVVGDIAGRDIHKDRRDT